MKTVLELKKEQEAAISALIKTCGVFFAFSNEQFEANKTPLKEGEKYVSIGAGGYMPKGNIDMWVNGYKEIEKAYKEGIKANKQRKQLIAYELCNHECFYTGDITAALEALGGDYTEAEVLAVFHKEKVKHYND